jgi:hypothetical protein
VRQSKDAPISVSTQHRGKDQADSEDLPGMNLHFGLYFWKVASCGLNDIGFLCIIGPRCQVDILPSLVPDVVANPLYDNAFRPGVISLELRDELADPILGQNEADLYYVSHWSLWLDVSRHRQTNHSLRPIGARRRCQAAGVTSSPNGLSQCSDSAIRLRPAGVFGPVDLPPWKRQRALPGSALTW